MTLTETTATVTAPTFRRAVRAWQVEHTTADNDNYPRTRPYPDSHSPLTFTDEAEANAKVAEFNQPCIDRKLAQIRRGNASLAQDRAEHDALVAAGLRQPRERPWPKPRSEEGIQAVWQDHEGVYSLDRTTTMVTVVWADLPDTEKDAIIAAMGRS